MASAVSARRRTAAALAAVLAAPLVLTACRGEQAKTEPASAASGTPRYNAEDVMFLQMMVAHHKQGLEMVRLAAGRAAHPQVRTLASAVDTTQSEELELMTSWLHRWKKPLASGAAAHTHQHHGASPGTTAKEIDTLRREKDAEFEPAFLTLFTAHQHNAVEMAQVERKNGANPDARAFAGRVVESRTAEIKQMLGFLNT
ncbi:DUF305 domain-containing protein [Actinomadura opuntiae]|uniref:DUF305 domain-containing protein n=1 Tax=Actinomadura sp. OS1-43 TaxID=604315 RepID=UPI00255AFC6E|nr:DUF305 domain-containing protein [Actinomadura sp. OS1-43]MDL4813369.1 DUF305 domain-containing protein [Actinomadura sp. OS1-43]